MCFVMTVKVTICAETALQEEVNNHSWENQGLSMVSNSPVLL